MIAQDNPTHRGQGLTFLHSRVRRRRCRAVWLMKTDGEIHSGLDGHNEIITLTNGALVDAADFAFI
jgi:hypothetical protein